MSFARFGCEESSVYLYDDSADGLCCCFCHLDPEQESKFFGENKEEFLKHMNEHKAQGHIVPESAYRQVNEWSKI